MTRQIYVDAPYEADKTAALRAGLLRLCDPSSIEGLETRGGENVAHADFPLHTYAIQQWPSGSDLESRIAATARALTAPGVVWTNDEKTIDEARAHILRSCNETHALLVAHGVGCDRLRLDPGGPWREARLLDLGWNEIVHPLLPAIRRIHSRDPGILWIRTETGRRKWNSRIGGGESVALGSRDAPGIVESMRVAARHAA